MMLIFLLLNMFVLGTVVGSLLNVCIYRIPLEKSILWPGSRCSHCLQRIRWYDNIPLVSYLILGGQCRSCRTRFSMRYFWVELLTGFCFAALFYLEVVDNIHQFPALSLQASRIERQFFPTWDAWVVFGYHALFVSFLIVATFCDLDRKEIPLTLTITGTMVGLAGAIVFPWPWPNHTSLAAGLPADKEWWLPNLSIVHGLYPWPVWGPLPDWLPPGSLRLGLATGLVGLLAGTIMLRLVRFLFTAGLGMEALGLGDADLMMMAGSFLGWQPLIVGFFLSVVPGLLLAVYQVLGKWMIAGSESTLCVPGRVKDGQPVVVLDETWTTIEQLVQAFAREHQKGKRALLLEIEGLEEFLHQSLESLQTMARKAGIRQVRLTTEGAGIMRTVMHWLGRQSPPSVVVEIVHRQDSQLYRMKGELVTKDKLPNLLLAQARLSPGIELKVDPTGLENWLNRAIYSIRGAARKAGIERFHSQDEGIPFGPALAIGLVASMLGWHWFGRGGVQMLLFNKVWFFGAAGLCAILMLALSYPMRLFRRLRG